MSRNKNHKSWSWIIIISFFALSIVNVWFGLFGFVCMSAPIFHAVRGGGKKHCAKFCPRGSFFQKILAHVSLDRKIPLFMTKKGFRHVLLGLMAVMLIFAMSHTGGDPVRIAFVMFRFMFSSFIVGTILGVLFKARTWCVVCPMGHAAHMIDKLQKKSQKEKRKKAA